MTGQRKGEDEKKGKDKEKKEPAAFFLRQKRRKRRGSVIIKDRIKERRKNKRSLPRHRPRRARATGPRVVVVSAVERFGIAKTTPCRMSRKSSKSLPNQFFLFLLSRPRHIFTGA